MSNLSSNKYFCFLLSLRKKKKPTQQQFSDSECSKCMKHYKMPSSIATASRSIVTSLAKTLRNRETIEMARCDV